MAFDPLNVLVSSPFLLNPAMDPVCPVPPSDLRELDEAVAKFFDCAQLEQGKQPFSFYCPDELERLMPNWKENRRQCKASLTAVLDLAQKSSNPTSQILKLVEVICAHNLFQCRTDHQAILLLLSLVRDKRIVQEAAYKLFCPELNSSADNDKLVDMMWCGIYFNDEQLVREAIFKGADVNCTLYANITPILLACSRGSENIARLLIEKGAKVQVVGGTHHHKTPLSEAMVFNRFSGSFVQDLTDLDAGFTPAFEALKNIAHRFSATTPQGDFDLQGQIFLLRGSRTRFSLTEYLKTAQSYYQNLKERLCDNPEEVFKGVFGLLSEETRSQIRSPEIRASLCAAIDRMLGAMEWSLLREKQFHQSKDLIADVSKAQVVEMMEKLDRGEPVICFDITKIIEGNPELHAWGLVSLKQPDGTYNVSRCDRGRVPPGIYTINVSRDDLIGLLEGYLKAANWKVDFKGKIGANFYTQADDLFTFSDKYRLVRNPNFIPQKGQRIGNCCYYSVQSLELAILTSLFEAVLGKGPDVVVLAKKTKQLRTTTVRIEELRQFIDLRGGSSGSASSSTSSETDSFTRQKERILSEIYYQAMDNRKLSDISEVFMPHAPHYDRILNDQALLCAWTKIVPKLFLLNKSLDRAELIKYCPDDIRNFMSSHQELIQKVTRIELINMDLKVFPLELLNFKGLTHLGLRCVELKRLPALDFPNLQMLNISDNSIRELPELNLPKLQHLYASKNDFSRIPDLSGMPELVDLDLKYNTISELGGLPPKLGILNLAGNRLSDIDVSLLQELVYLSLSSNPIASIPSINSPKLKSLYLDGIGLREITETDLITLNALTNLTWLNLASNSLMSKPELNLPNCEIVSHGNLFEGDCDDISI